MKVRGQKPVDKVEIPMTPMIDIVFQLLVFFIMTLKIVAPEGDFNIKMPLAAPSEGPPDPDILPPIKLRLIASPGGDLAEVRMNDRSLPLSGVWGPNGVLRNEIVSLTKPGADGGEDVEVEIDADYNLHYRNIIEAMTAVTGRRENDNSVTQLVEQVKFAPPKPKP